MNLLVFHVAMLFVVVCSRFFFFLLCFIFILHFYYSECWNGYLAIQVKERSQRITCCGADCNMVMDEFTVMNLLVSEKNKQMNEGIYIYNIKL